MIQIVNKHGKITKENICQMIKKYVQNMQCADRWYIIYI